MIRSIAGRARPLRPLVALLFCGGCSGAMSVADTPPADLAVLPTPDLAATPDLVTPITTVSVAGSTVDLSGRPLRGVTIGIKELPGASATSDDSGKYRIEAPRNRVITFTASRTGYAKTVEQQITVLRAVTGFILPLATQADFDAIQKLGGAPAATGVIGVVIGVGQNCVAGGTKIGTAPAVGKVLYVPAGGGGGRYLPEPGLTAAEAGPQINAYVTGARGTVAPTADSPRCTAAGYPVKVSADYSIEGPVVVEAGAYHDAQVLLQ